jgi:cytochrome c peroxidase
VGTAGAVCPQHLQFLGARCAEWQSWLLPPVLPASRGNRFADNEAAAALGMKVFFDNRFSRSGSGIACANCHDPEHAFAETKRTSNTLRPVARNAPDLLNAAWYTHSHFWDGKVENLWSAPLFTFEQPDEMGSSRLTVAHAITIYKIRYEKIFGPLPDFSDPQRFPAFGKPGTADYDRMSKADQKLVDQVYVNVGKALEAYVRKLAAGRAPFDDFLLGSAQVLSPDAQRGMVAFNRHHCEGCHSGPTFTDEKFHNLGYPGNPGQLDDLARAGGITFAKTWRFTSTSEFADPATGVSPVASTDDRGSDPQGFRTPTLRNLLLSFPYGHNGAFDTLESALQAHSKVLPKKPALDARDTHDIIAFLHSLSGRPPQPPWNYWPGG